MKKALSSDVRMKTPLLSTIVKLYKKLYSSLFSLSSAFGLFSSVPKKAAIQGVMAAVTACLFHPYRKALFLAHIAAGEGFAEKSSMPAVRTPVLFGGFLSFSPSTVYLRYTIKRAKMQVRILAPSLLYILPRFVLLFFTKN